MASGFDDEELSMSLGGPAISRQHTRPAPRRPAHAAEQVTNKVPTDRRTAQRIGLYDVKKTLGEGSFGKVKLATHQVTKQEVALKIISRKKLISRDLAGRVEREIQYLQLLRHPHIIKLYTVITTPAEIIMVLEYAGGELFDYLVSHGKMTEEKARRFFQQIVCAVEYCHRHKIVHRDLKPENLLLDNDLNVKIADFGLSNIMSDGNFLKTSCGSPNYAAPEVISGKLYAGPEVDVWSCGVILYVLLVGRLPFDDDYIPNLFKKIASGNFSTPAWISRGANHLLHKLLKVNPVQRITIQDIRLDPWFNEGLEEYLKQPVDEFIDTGVDPNKAIDPRKLAPGKPTAVQEQIHDSVVGKLGKTMGYAKDDVQDALGKNEPNAIKDAYLIVRENQIMQANPKLNTENNFNPFLAMSPPTYAMDMHMPASPRPLASRLADAAHNHTEELSLAERVHQEEGPSSGNINALDSDTPSSMTTDGVRRESMSEVPDQAYVSKIGVLTSSLPTFHNAYMEARKKDHQRANTQDHGEMLSPLSTLDEDKPSVFTSLGSMERSPEERQAMIRHLKPHSRSTVQLQRITQNSSMLQEGGAIIDNRPKSKHKPTKWQFGIRSRNEPVDAIKCLYRALTLMGDCQWRIDPPTDNSEDNGEQVDEKGNYTVNVEGAQHLPPINQNLSESPDKQRHRLPAHHMNHIQSQPSSPQTDKESADAKEEGSKLKDPDDIDPNVIPEGYAPKDPWCINVRWTKKGMSPPRAGSAASTQGSAVDLNLVDGESRHESQINSLNNSVFGSMTSVENNHFEMPGNVNAESSCFVYLDLQIYVLEQDVYLVDFKNAGYEPIVGERKVKNKQGELVTEYIGNGQRKAEKDVTSPQPFLDLANRLVIHLAKGAHS